MNKDNTFGSLGTGELRPGQTPRRWEPEGGVTKLNEKIHKESKFADHYKNLPFEFRKPLKSKGRSSVIRCDNCGKILYGTTATVGVICSGCNKFSSVSEVTYETD
jgi:formylmethanofuran dehydrogenase subunit E